MTPALFTNSRSTLFSRISFGILLATISLLPIFFVPFVATSLFSAKGLLLGLGVTFSVIFLLLAFLFEGSITVPKHTVLYASLGVVGSFLVSAFFSPSGDASFWGATFSPYTFFGTLALFVMFWLLVFYIRSAKRALYVIGGLCISFLVIAVLQIVGLFVSFSALAPGFFASFNGQTFIGSLTDFGFWATIISLCALLAFEILSVSRKIKLFLASVIVIGLFFVALLNNFTVWIIFGIGALLVFVYGVSTFTYTGETKSSKIFPTFSFVLVLVSLLCILANSTVGSLLPRVFNIVNTDIRPSISASATVFSHMVLHRPVTGQGLDRFEDAWALYKPAAVTATPYWDARFPHAFGILPTLFVTSGILGTLAILFFLVSFIWFGWKNLFVRTADKISQYLLFVSFSGSIISWVIVAIATPGFIPYALAFVFSGLFLGLVYRDKQDLWKTYEFINDPRTSFFSILGIMFVFAAILFGGLIFTRQYIAEAYITKSIVYAQNTPDLARAERAARLAVRWFDTSLAHKSLARVSLLELGALAKNESISADALKPELQKLVLLAESEALAAVSLDKKNADNWIFLGSVYDVLQGFGVSGAYDNGKSAYTQAIVYAPKNPGIYLNLATLALGKKSYQDARDYVNQALVMKPNMADAYFVLSQIDVAAGNLDRALENAEKASTVAPNDASTFFRLGTLAYNNKSYQKAIGAFERAVILNPYLLNAHYFLGLSYAQVGRTDDAIAQFEYLKNQLPNNTQISSILTNLKAGVPAFGSPVVVPEETTKTPEKKK